jgi:hypothetical protein
MYIPFLCNWFGKYYNRNLFRIWRLLFSNLVFHIVEIIIDVDQTIGK